MIYVDPNPPSEKSTYPPYLLWGTESKNPFLEYISVQPFWTYVTNFKFLISKLLTDNYTLSLPKSWIDLISFWTRKYYSPLSSRVFCYFLLTRWRLLTLFWLFLALFDSFWPFSLLSVGDIYFILILGIFHFIHISKNG